MSVTPTPVFAQSPSITSVTLAAQTACTTRAPTATASLAGANIIQFVNTSTNGLTAFANSKGQALFHSNWREEFDFKGKSVTRYDQFFVIR